MKYSKTQEFVAEFLGTMVLILFGCGSVAMVVLFGSTPSIPGEVVKGGYTNIVIGWGLAVTMGIYIAGTISGAHLNPAVTVSLAATGPLPVEQVPALHPRAVRRGVRGRRAGLSGLSREMARS